MTSYIGVHLARREIKLEKIFHLLSIGNKPEQLWSLAQLSLLKGRASRWPPVQACAVSWQLEWADSRQHFPFVKTCPAIAWSVLWIYNSLAVKDCQGSIFSTLAYSFHCMATQCQHPQSQQTQIPAPVKTTKTRSKLQLCKFQLRRRFAASLLPRLFGRNPTWAPQVGFELETNGFQFYAIANLDKISLNMSLQNNKIIYCTGYMQGLWQYWWFHQRTPEREQSTPALVLYQFDIDMYLPEILLLHKVLSSVISIFCI